MFSLNTELMTHLSDFSLGSYYGNGNKPVEETFDGGYVPDVNLGFSKCVLSHAQDRLKIPELRA